MKTRARLQHTLQAIALNHALHQGHALWSQAGQSALVALPLPPYTSQRRTELLSLYQELQKRIQELDKEVEAQARRRPQARRLAGMEDIEDALKEACARKLDLEVYCGLSQCVSHPDALWRVFHAGSYPEGTHRAKAVCRLELPK